MNKFVVEWTNETDLWLYELPFWPFTSAKFGGYWMSLVSPWTGWGLCPVKISNKKQCNQRRCNCPCLVLSISAVGSDLSELSLHLSEHWLRSIRPAQQHLISNFSWKSQSLIYKWSNFTDSRGWESFACGQVLHWDATEHSPAQNQAFADFDTHFFTMAAV